MKKLLLVLFFGIFFISLASADLGTFKQGECISLYQFCDDCTYVNLTTVQYPNGTIETINEAMTKSDVDYNYTFCSTNDLGNYYYVVKGDTGGSTATERLSFSITSTGKSFNSGQSLSSLGILFGSLFVAFLFLYLGFKISVNPKMIPIAFVFIVISLLLIIYSLFLGWTIGSDIIEHEAFSSTSETIFVAVLWLMVAVAIISFIFFFFSFIKELGTERKLAKFGDGFNPLTDSYDY
jgi:hypothetical protein